MHTSAHPDYGNFLRIVWRRLCPAWRRILFFQSQFGFVTQFDFIAAFREFAQ